MARARHYRVLIVLTFLSFVALGLPTGLLGTAWPSLRTSLGRPVSDLGGLLAIGTVGYGMATFFSGRVAARFAVGPILVTAMGTGILSLSAYAMAGEWWLILVAAIVLGISGGLIDAVLNSYVALHHGVRMMGLLHACFGLGATLGPLVITAVLAADRSWRFGYWIVALYEVMLFVLLCWVRKEWRRVEDSLKDPGTGPTRWWVVGGLMALFFVYTGLEIGTGQWAYSFLTEGRNVSEVAAGVWVALYWGGLTGGRLMLGAVGHRISTRAVLGVSTVGTVFGLGWLWWDPASLGVVGLLVAGASLASVFPTLVALTPEKVGAVRAPHIIGYEITAAGVGAAFIPWLAGELVKGNTLGVLGPYFTATAVVLAILHFVIERASGPRTVD